MKIIERLLLCYGKEMYKLLFYITEKSFKMYFAYKTIKDGTLRVGMYTEIYFSEIHDNSITVSV